MDLLYFHTFPGKVNSQILSIFKLPYSVRCDPDSIGDLSYSHGFHILPVLNGIMYRVISLFTDKVQRAALTEL